MADDKVESGAAATKAREARAERLLEGGTVEEAAAGGLGEAVGAEAATASPRLLAVHALAARLRAAHPERGFLLHPALEFASGGGGGEDELYARVGAPVGDGEILLVLPRSARLAQDNLPPQDEEGASLPREDGTAVQLSALMADVSRRFKAAVQGDSPLQVGDVCAAVLVMRAAAEPDGGAWAAIAATWPRVEQSTHLSMYWGAAEMAAAEGTLACGLAGALHETSRRIFDEVVLPALYELRVERHFLRGAAGRSDATPEALWQAFRYAVAMQTSRAHDGDGVTPELAPLVDLINGLPASREGACNVGLAAGKWPFLHHDIFRNDCDLACSAVYAKRALAAGEELLISYGDIPPSAFIFKYGCLPEQLLAPSVTMDRVLMWVPPSFAPAGVDADRASALSNNGYPTTAAEIREQLCFQLEPPMLQPYFSAGVAGPTGGMGEHPALTSLRQFLLLAKLADADAVRLNLESGRLRGNFSGLDIAHLLQQVCDYNLGQIAGGAAVTSAEDLCFARRKVCSKPLAVVALARVVQREALAVWRHAFSRKYSVASHMERIGGGGGGSPPLPPHVLAYQIGLPSARVSRPEVPAALRPGGPSSGGGCVQCGRTLKLKSCSRCHTVWYCCRGCQKAHWRHHKQHCKAVK